MWNRCEFIGRLTRDPETSFINSGKQVTKFSLATSKKRAGGEEITTYINIVCWDHTAKFVADYLTKGSLCFVSGEMQNRKWQDKDGNNRYTTEIIASTVQNLSPRKEGGGRIEEPPQSGGYGDEESVPF